MKHTHLKQYKKGAASMYIVIFATLILSVIALSFIQLMSSNTNNTVNDDLSISAYDSALAGIEDAKIALTKYHNCIDQGSSATNECRTIIQTMQDGIKNGSCDTVSTTLGRTNTSNPQAVVIQETSSATDASDSSNMLQAYTCVKITEDLTDYRGTLASDNRTTVIPLRTSDYKNVRALKIMWHESSEHLGDSALGDTLPAKTSGQIPALVVDYYQTADSFTIGQLSTMQKDSSGKIHTDHGTIFLHPNIKDTTRRTVNIISQDEAAGLTDKLDNPTSKVTCSNDAFMCTAVINLPLPIGATDSGVSGGISRNASTFFLRLSIPYAEDTTFSVTMCKNANCAGADGIENPSETTAEGKNNIAFFTGVQARIDSTGRANDVYRRVDARVELVETGFPYPEYTIWMAGDNQKDIDKSFWVTKECYIKRDSESAMERCQDYGSTI